MAMEEDQGGSFNEYFRRVLHYEQMDLDYTFCQMLYVCFSPSKLYQIAGWRKSTLHSEAKNQWARDDPAFAVMIIIGLTIAATAYAIALTQDGLWGWFKVWFYSVGLHFLMSGIVIASAT
jgi:hypothetical protein